MTFTVAAAKLGAGWPWEGIGVEALSVCGPSTCPSAGCTRRRGLFWGLRGTDLVGLEMIPGGWAFGIRGRSGWLWRICWSRLVTQGKSAGRWFAKGKALDWVGFQRVAGKSGRERMFPGQKRSPALQCGERGFRKLFVVSGKSGQALEACPLWLWFEVLDVKSWTVTDPGWPHRSHHTSTLQRLVRTQMGGRPEGCMNGGG